MTLSCLYRLSEAELKYRNRESRPEDIERITELNKIAGELERRLKELLVSSLISFKYASLSHQIRLKKGSTKWS